MSRAITHSNWRHARPFAPDLEVSTYRGQPLDISLKGYLVQGAKDMQTGERDPSVIEQHKAQRGWACNFFQVSDPLNGILSRSTFADGFRYISDPAYIGDDCFSYVINNGFQNSMPGKIVVNVRNYMEGRIVIEEDVSQRTNNSRAFRYVAQWYIPPEFAGYTHIVATWYEHKPVSFWQNDQVVVRTVKQQKAQTVLTQNNTRPDGYQYVTQNYVFPTDGSFQTVTWPDPDLRGKTNADTGVPYVQPAGPWPVSVVLSFRRQRVVEYTAYITRYGSRFPTPVRRYRTEWQIVDDIEVDVRAAYGPQWWRSGSIQSNASASFSPSRPGPFTPTVVT